LKLSEESYYEFSTNLHDYEKLMTLEKVSTNKLNGLTKTHIELYLHKINNTMQKIADIMKEINNTIVFETNSGYCLRKIYRIFKILF
jgi:L-arabinose isomerase